MPLIFEKSYPCTIPFSNGVQASAYSRLVVVRHANPAAVVDPGTGETVATRQPVSNIEVNDELFQDESRTVHFLGYNPEGRRVYLVRHSAADDAGCTVIVEGDEIDYPCPTVDEGIAFFAMIGGEGLVIDGQIILPTNHLFANYDPEKFKAIRGRVAQASTLIHRVRQERDGLNA